MTNNLTPETVLDVHVGDRRALSFLFKDAEGMNARVLTNHAAEAVFWVAGSAPHVVRAAAVQAGSGLAVYQLRGDEFAAVGTCFAQFTLTARDWHSGSGVGTAAIATSSAIMKFNVKRAPA